jgi:dienelactone hydrolase
MIKNLIVSDIFGKTAALITLGEAIGADEIIDPYDGVNMNFESETQAYNYFIENVGIDSYLEKLSKVLNASSDECMLIGFSVGASIIWQLSELTSKHINKIVKKAICYYGSQIRYSTQLSPVFNVKVIFPKRESHFDVLALQNKLIKKDNVSAIQVEYLHGFMNIHSQNFNREGYIKHLELLGRLLQ